MKIYTKTGDDGTTGLFNGQRVNKNSLRVEAYGTVDELNSVLGISLSACSDSRLKNDLMYVSNLLFTLGSELATPPEPQPKAGARCIDGDSIEWLERKIDEYTVELPQLRNFILPGGCLVSAYLHQARTVCRRAERRVITLSEVEPVGIYAVRFLNRLSDYLFTASRFANLLNGSEDIKAKF